MSSSPSILLDQILSARTSPSRAAHDYSNERRSQVRLAFLYQCDSAAEYTNGKRRKKHQVASPASLLGFELLSAYWFRKVWQNYLSVLGHGALPGQLEQALGNHSRIQDGFDGLSRDLRQRLYDAHLRYGMRTLLESDPAPVALAELIASPTLLRAKHVREGDWYLIEYRDGGSLQAPRQPTKLDEIVYTSIGLSSDQDGRPRRGTLLRIVPLAVEDRALHALLQALHFPQAEPQAGPRAGEEGRPPRGDMPRIVMDESQHFVMKAADGDFPLSFARRRDQPTSKSSRHAALMNAIVAGRQQAMAPPPPAGSPGPHVALRPGQPQAQSQCNPMTWSGSGPQPFVGVNMVGAGNNMALYGRDGIVAYVDFGAPLPANENTAPSCANPCVCDDPRMILSHWDYDHYAMVRKVGGAWQRRWLAPQQVLGSVSARELYMRLLAAAPRGGALALWPISSGPTHLNLPFGYVERGTGAPVNDDCLAVHVRTRDDPAGPPAAAWPAIFASRSAPTTAAGPARPRAVIVSNHLEAAWFDTAAHTPWRYSVAVPLTTRPMWLWHPSPPRGATVWGKVLAPTIGRSIRACWIPAAGLPVPGHPGGKTDKPALPSGKPWPGGWAMSATDFVDLGGCIVDFPSGASGVPVDNVMCVSPTPGTIWAAPARPSALGPGGAIWFPATSGWKPAWRSGGWMLPLPVSGAAALAPLPAGPTPIVPAVGAAPVTAKEEYILLPGDAGYQHLPSLQTRKKAIAGNQAVPTFVGMVATHHGSDSWIPKTAALAIQATAHIPTAGTPKIVYSYGTRIHGSSTGAHCYVVNGDGHPRPDAINAYSAFGWGSPDAAGPYAFNRLNTAPHDFESAQPFNPLGLASGTGPAVANSDGHYNGNVALTPHMSSVVASLIHTCPHCKQQRKYYF
ncbi:hypothetical protein [Massilia sp. DD77]|uniref:hypothetical protein n=1 Tax=Massilia sp. DD77 TaxID=3109349 RepID=UPI002FFE4C47